MKTNAIIVLKPKEERRIIKGHLWIFSNEIQSVEGNATNGDWVEVVNSTRTRSFGFGFYNQNSLVAVRIASRMPVESMRAFLQERIETADKKRRQVGFEHSYRLVFGESDFLPGLIIDKFGNDYVIESFSAGADRMLDDVCAILVDSFHAVTVYEKSLSPWRTLELLEQRQRVLHGETGECVVSSSSMLYNINILEGQKTGFFLDQSENRKRIESFCAGKRVLDCFCNDGGFALHAAKGGATSVTGIDASASAVARAIKNARLNNLHGFDFVREDVFSFLHRADAEGKTWDVVIVDPPAFVKSRKTLATGMAGYEKLNRLALRVLEKNGLLVSCSCSQHVQESDFHSMLAQAAGKERRGLQAVAVTGAAGDHPVLLSMPETRYLKCMFAFAP